MTPIYWSKEKSLKDIGNQNFYYLYQPISSSNGISPIQFVQSSFSVYKKAKKKETA
jgi:hypothetical protein